MGNEGLAIGPVVAKRYITERDGRVCSECGCVDWNGRELVFVLDHIDGNADNWDVLNLCFVRIVIHKHL